ncbi:glycosyltransferase [Hanamia caeni]|uniref:Glycosyltransferase n=1 Tax=Hanamia caeni TaxID=2294116 RepID=A0A3M9NI99_9BACT|nr:glycosyltransferase family 4 protein [Hanamia caeni]RNI37484.1 glycosyltransferase [Hanamia caeni]
MNLAILGICDFEEWNNADSLNLGGSSGVIKSILPYLEANKIYLLGITSKKKNLNKEIKINKNIIIYPIVYIPKKSKIPERILTFWYSRKINKVLEKFNIHSIYSHAEEMLYWVNPGYNILYHMHGANNALSKAKKRIFRNKLFLYLWSKVRKRNIKNANRIIVIDYLSMEIVKKYKKLENAILIPNFVDTSIFYQDNSRSELLKDITQKVVLFVGRIEEVKGLKLFVDILNILDKKEKDVWKGVIVGRGTYKKTIETYIENESNEKLFFFAGAVFDQHELRKIYNQSTVLIISSFFEGIPMVILEALACNTSVVSTNVGGIKRLIADEEKCFVIDERVPSLFAEKILQIQINQKKITSEFKFSVKNSSATINELLKNNEKDIMHSTTASPNSWS